MKEEVLLQFHKIICKPELRYDGETWMLKASNRRGLDATRTRFRTASVRIAFESQKLYEATRMYLGEETIP